ncbi:hypothetical protein B0H17DRAFT_39004 [Mycena rosella]|uniref:F-box domain-containing protein n=1 Tax=Mycena rosella TaxID=1033263 RepID=A0AAD7M6S7_MYCRO|nr:hypothetical protein B0H17DRAFT_39004 [Mycena rosella]
MPPGPIDTLTEYLFLLICLELDLKDVLSLRRVSRVFGQATRNKLLWIHLLDSAASEEGSLLPTYLKKRDLLDAGALEALATRVSRVTRKWRAKDLCPVNVWRLHLQQSITWLRLVSGNWLFVASSDNHISKISCWDLSLLFQGYVEPIAEAYLPGQVKTAQVEVQAAGVVLALGLGTTSPSVLVITLRQHLESHYFAELARMEGSSHILMLHGNLVGCAMRDDVIIPHIVNWHENTIHELPPPPGGFDMPERRSVPHLLFIWNGLVVIVRRDLLEFYNQPSPAAGATYIKSIKTIEIWEVVVLDRRAVSLAPLKLLVISSSGVELLTIESDIASNGDVTCAHFCLATAPGHGDTKPWYHLIADGSGDRALWLNIAAIVLEVYPSHPYITSIDISRRPSELEAPLILWTNDLPHDPAVWAYPAIDLDAALGYTVIGNCFGELAIYDCVGSDPTTCCGLASDFTLQQNTLPPLLSLTPIPLGLRVTPSRPLGQTKSDPLLFSRWTQDDLNLDLRLWCRDFMCAGYLQRNRWHAGYWKWDRWQGVLGDYAWLLEHAHGFPASPVPQAHADDSNTDETYVLVRSGNRYLTRGTWVRSFPLGPLPTPLGMIFGQEQPCLRPTAYTEASIYDAMWYREYRTTGGRNRWVEQQERGGRPHENLVDIAAGHCVYGL